jgi:hypothetical protein
MRRRKTVRVNGVDYEIDSEKIMRLAARLEPKGIDKYWVKLQGRRFPPKQIVAELLDIPLVDFTSMDAGRVLGAVGIDVHSADEKPEAAKPRSEDLLLEYLRSHGLTDVEVLPGIENTTTRPDYLVRADGFKVLLQVENFQVAPEDMRVRGGTYNPYGPVREKFYAARRKFKEMEEHCCCLVLQNQDRPSIGLNWQIIMGAMLSDLGCLASKGIRADATQVAQETPVISAVLVVERYAIGEKRFQLFVHDQEQQLGRELSIEEYARSVENSAATERDLSLNRVRVRVHENPYAKVPLDRRLFCGPFDERYGQIEGPTQWGRIQAGQGVSEFEARSPAAKLLSRS